MDGFLLENSTLTQLTCLKKWVWSAQLCVNQLALLHIWEREAFAAPSKLCSGLKQFIARNLIVPFLFIE